MNVQFSSWWLDSSRYRLDIVITLSKAQRAREVGTSTSISTPYSLINISNLHRKLILRYYFQLLGSHHSSPTNITEWTDKARQWLDLGLIDTNLWKQLVAHCSVNEGSSGMSTLRSAAANCLVSILAFKSSLSHLAKCSLPGSRKRRNCLASAAENPATIVCWHALKAFTFVWFFILILTKGHLDNAFCQSIWTRPPYQYILLKNCQGQDDPLPAFSALSKWKNVATKIGAYNLASWSHNLLLKSLNLNS